MKKVNFSTHFLLAFIFLFFAITNSCKNGGSGSRSSKTNSNQNDSLTNPILTKVNYNVYIENSGSMDGYVSTPSDFKNSVYGLITKLLTKNIASNISLNFVSDKICEVNPKALPDDIKKFIFDLNTIKKQNKNHCDFTSSDLPVVLKNVIPKNPNDVNILVSDCILSLNKDSKNYLVEQQNSTNLFLATELKMHDFSTVILKLNSEFKGWYYQESVGGTRVDVSNSNIRRPYYIIIFGKQESLNSLLTEVDFKTFRGFENSYYLLTPSASRPNAKVIRNNKTGDFEIEQPATKLIINNAKTGGRNSKTDIFQFSIATNLEFLKMDDSYLANPDNYDISPNYVISSIERNTDETNESLKGYTHIFTIKTEDLKDKQDITIKLRSKLPSWVTATSTEQDSDPLDTTQQKQTFGFAYLVAGISGAYSDKYKGKEQFAITIKVSKDNYVSHGTHSSFPWWIIVTIISIVGILIWLKNKK